MDCNIHDLDIDLHAETEASYRKKLLTAQTCDDFVATEQMRGVELIQVDNKKESSLKAEGLPPLTDWVTQAGPRG